MPEPQHYGSVGIILPSLRPLGVDEKCWALIEEDRLSEDGKRLERIQRIQVVRDGRRVEFSKALGPAENYAGGPFLIPAMETDSVGNVADMADRLRIDKGLLRAMEAHEEAEGNIIERAIERIEMTREYMRRNHRTYRRDSRKG